MPDLCEPPFLHFDLSRISRTRCGSHHRGHTPHFIQVRQCHTRSLEDDWRRVVVMDVVSGAVVLANGGRLRRYRNHEARYLRAVVASVGAEAMLNTNYGVLFMRPWPHGARSVFSLADAARPLGECSVVVG